MPNTPEYLEGYRFSLLSKYALEYFTSTLEIPTIEYIFDDSNNFLIKKFYDFKNELIKDYLNLISKDYKLIDDTSIKGYFEEKDRRSISSKERNTIHYLKSKLKHQTIQDLYEEPAFMFDLKNKSFVLEIQGVNTLKLDYSEVEFSQASGQFKSFLKQNAYHMKKSIAKSNLSVEQLFEEEILFEKKISKESKIQDQDDEVKILHHTDIQIIKQLEFWLVAEEQSADNYFRTINSFIPISIKLSSAREIEKAACLLTGILNSYDTYKQQGMVLCKK